jgi:hypothetical protein
MLPVGVLLSLEGRECVVIAKLSTNLHLYTQCHLVSLIFLAGE